MNYKEARKTAADVAEQYGVSIEKAYTLGKAYVFESNEECMGIFPLVVDENGERSGLWKYINEHDLTMDDMEEVE